MGMLPSLRPILGVGKVILAGPVFAIGMLNYPPLALRNQTQTKTHTQMLRTEETSRRTD